MARKSKLHLSREELNIDRVKKQSFKLTYDIKNLIWLRMCQESNEIVWEILTMSMYILYILCKHSIDVYGYFLLSRNSCELEFVFTFFSLDPIILSLCLLQSGVLIILKFKENIKFSENWIKILWHVSNLNEFLE